MIRPEVSRSPGSTIRVPTTEEVAMSESAGSKVSFSFGILAIIFVAIDLFADHQTWAGVAAIVCVLIAMFTRPSGFFGTRGPA